MARRLLAALALAHGAAALLDGFVDVLVNVDVRIPKDIVAQAMGAATEDEAYNACSSIDSRLYDCYESGWLEPTAPAASVRNCLCCAGTAAIAESYSVCSSYIANSVGGDDASTAVKSISIIGAQCAAVGASSCAANTQVQPAPTTTKSPTGVRNSVPTACSSMLTIYNSCDKILNFQTARARDAASCLCYNRAGDFNTVFEDYARTCASFAKTAITEDYTVMTRLATICEDYPSTSSMQGLQFSTIGTRTTVAIDNASTQSSSSTAAPTGESSVDGGQVADSSTSSGLAAPTAVPGFLAWAANWATFLLSFYILM
ncbi:hypothetical protein N0V88_005131 [Collariella sp. IMI 366227]|nr:hypothetical protein N0V88_005131 [Collariella sp. IMI 366227]